MEETEERGWEEGDRGEGMRGGRQRRGDERRETEEREWEEGDEGECGEEQGRVECGWLTLL